MSTEPRPPLHPRHTQHAGSGEPAGHGQPAGSARPLAQRAAGAAPGERATRFDPATSESSGLFSLSQIRHLVRIEFSRAQRYGYGLSVLVLSVDRLVELRDRHGYDFKEGVVDDVAALLQRRTRSCDYLGRLVDDRLMAVLPHTPSEGAAACAARLIGEVGELAPEAPGGEAAGRRVAVSLSIGSCSFDGQNAMFFDQLWEAAEQALEAAQAQGGGRHLARAPGPG